MTIPTHNLADKYVIFMVKRVSPFNESIKLKFRLRKPTKFINIMSVCAKLYMYKLMYIR